jgi:DNA-binding CsgD family transcriptional regulator
MKQGHKVLVGALRELKTRPLISLGFALFWFWVWTIVQSSFLNSGHVFAAISGVTKWVVPLAAYGLTFLVMGLLYYFKRLAPQSATYLLSFSIITSFGVIACAIFTHFPTTNPTVTALLLMAGALIAGAGTACLHVEWGRLFGRLGPRKTIIHGTFGTLGAMGLILIALLIPDSVVCVLVALLPPGCCACILRQRQGMVTTTTKKKVSNLYIPWRFLCTSFIQGTAFGILQSILHVAQGALLTILISVAGCLIGTLALFLVVFLFRLDFNQLMYQIGFVILAMSFVFMAVGGALFTSGWLLNAVGYRFVDILMWALCAHLIRQRGLPTNWVFPVTACALIAGQVLGALSGAFVQDAFDGRHGSLYLLSISMIFIILTGALLMSNRSNVQKGWGMIRPSDSDEQNVDFAILCALVTDGFELTPRENEVFALLAQKHNKAFISQSLFLSIETVKTHTRNIYRKMELHSQEDLVALVTNQLQQDKS